MITMDDIVREGHPSLRKKADEVEVPLSEENKQLLNDMLTFLKNSQEEEIAKKYGLRAGVGLAATQLNINKRLVAVHFEDPKGNMYTYGLVNPKVISHSVEQAYITNGEGCLSVDRDVEGIVPRHARITVKAMDIDGNPLKLRLRDFPAIVFQHEIDHLNGIMFYDYIDEKNPLLPPENAKAV